MDSTLPGLVTAPNLHPIFVHFPIALWITALLFLAVGTFRQHENLLLAGRWTLYLGTASAVLAVGSGFWATNQMGHDSPGHDLVHVHRNFMLMATGLALVGTVLTFTWRRSDTPVRQWTQLAFLVAAVLVMTLGADRGAELVFHYGIGTTRAALPAASEHEHDDHNHDHEDGLDHLKPETDSNGGAHDRAAGSDDTQHDHEHHH